MDIKEHWSEIRLHFNTSPGNKLYGNSGEKREASKLEISRLKQRIKITNSLKGNTYFWGDMLFVRDFFFAKRIELRKMTKQIKLINYPL